MPVVKVEVGGLLALAMQLVPVTVGNDGINKRSFLVSHAEVERSNVHRYSDAEVVGIDLRQTGLLPCIADGLGSATHQAYHANQYI